MQCTQQVTAAVLYPFLPALSAAGGASNCWAWLRLAWLAAVCQLFRAAPAWAATSPRVVDRRFDLVRFYLLP